MRISLVSPLNLFLILIILSFKGYVELILVSYLKIATIYLSLDEHLHLIKSPILKVTKLGG